MKKLLLIFGLICIYMTSNAQHSLNLYASQDLYVETFGGGQGKNAFMKFNISALPAGIVITGAYFKAYVYKSQLVWDGDVKWIHYNNQTWAEGDSNKHMWIPAYFVDTLTQLNGFGTNLNAINTSIDLKDFLKVDYAASHTYFSFFGKDVDDPTSWPNMTAVSFNNSDSMLCGNIFSDMMGFRPRNYINPNQWPYLTIDYGIPPIIGTVTGTTAGCEGGSATLIAAVTGDSPLTYQWKKNGTNIAGATTTTLVINPLTSGSAGNYTFVACNPYGCDTSNVVMMTVNPLPSVYVNPDTVTICQGQSDSLYAAGATTYVWSAIPWSGNPLIVAPAVTTTYTVTGTESTTGCYNTATAVVIVDPCTSIEQIEKAECNVFPNPAKDEINIQTPSGPMHIMIFNSEGMKVDEVYSPVSTAQVSLSNRATGIYTVKIISGKNVFVKKVILQ